MDKKKKNNWFLKSIGLLFIVYISITIAIDTGYYEAKLSERTIITDDAMKQFEEDLKKGLPVDIKDYVTNSYTDYSNNVTKAGVGVSNMIEKLMSEGINKAINVFKTLFT